MRRLCPGPAPWAHRHTVLPVRTRARSRKRPGRIRGEASGNEHVEPNQREPSAEEVSSPQFRNLGDAAAAKSEHRLDEGLEFLVRGASLIAAKPRLCNHHSHASTSLLAVKKCGIRAPFVARSLRFVGTPHRAFWMVCSCGHDRIAVTLERSRVRAVRPSNLSETAKMGVGRK